VTELEKYITTTMGVAEDDVQRIASFFQPITLLKGEYFLKAGRMSERLAFVQEGILREYVARDEQEVTKWICTKGYFVVDLSAFIFRKPARFNLQALTDVELHVIDAANYKRIGEVLPDWNELEKRFITRCFSALEDRVLMHLSMTAAERYDLVFAQRRELFNHVPLHYLASMLGMTPETLSRLRARAAT